MSVNEIKLKAQIEFTEDCCSGSRLAREQNFLVKKW